MTIQKSNGYVGIGTTSPARNLHIYDSSGGATLKIESNTANAYDSSKIELIGGNLSTGEIIFGDPIDSDVGKIIYRHDGNSLAFNVSASEKMRIDSSGNVGIGTTSPSAKLDIRTTSDQAIFASTNGGYNALEFTSDSGTTTGSLIAFSNTIRLGNASAVGGWSNGIVIDSSGQVGIGTSSPSRSLHVKKSGDNEVARFESDQTTSFIELEDANTTGQILIGTQGDNFKVHTAGTERFRINGSGNVGIGTTSPNAKLQVNDNVRIGNTSTGVRFYIRGADEFGIDAHDVSGNGWNSLHLRADGTTGLFLQKDTNNVGIGTTSPSAKLDVNGSASFNNAVVVDGLDTGNPIPPTNQTRISGYGMIGNRGSFYITNGSSNGTIFWGIGSNHNAATKMTLRNTGNLGIGTTSPNTKLEVGDCESSGNIADGNIAVKTKSNNTAIVIQEASGAEQWGLGVNVDGDLIFTDSGTERIRFDDGTGNVGIGTSSPSQVLHAKANDATLLLQDSTTSFSSQASGIILTCSDGSGNARTDVQYKLKVNSTNFEITYGSSNAQRFKIEQDGGLFVPSLLGSSDSNPLVRYNTTTGELYYNSSSIRYKEDVTDIESTIDKINKLRPVKFKVKESQQYTTGLIAEEVVEVIPELTFKNKVEGFDEPQIDGVSYGDLPTYLLKAIQEQQEMINELKTEIQTLKSQINS
jgi:hypothetical protein